MYKFWIVFLKTQSIPQPHHSFIVNNLADVSLSRLGVRLEEALGMRLTWTSLRPSPPRSSIPSLHRVPGDETVGH